MATSISELIADRIDTMPAGERRAAQTLIANYPLIGPEDGRRVLAAGRGQLADNPSLRRASRFPELPGVSNGPAGRTRRAIAIARFARRPPAARSTRALRYIEATLENIRETFRHVSEQQIAEIVALLSNRKSKAFLIGGRFTDPIARYMAAHLTIIRPNVFHLAGQESNWRDRLIDMGKRDVLLIFDIRRYQESLIRFAEKAHQRGVQIVLFTDQWLSPIARFARHVLAGRTAVPSPFDSSAALFVVAETLISELTRRLETDSARRIREMENLR